MQKAHKFHYMMLGFLVTFSLPDGGSDRQWTFSVITRNLAVMPRTWCDREKLGPSLRLSQHTSAIIINNKLDVLLH